ncbi:MAG TPA: hypothetical protein VH458_09575 [Vicinamibacterales bacterium]|jgi:hypothetical protein
MSPMLVQLDGILLRIEQLAERLRADSDRDVHRHACELRAAFADRTAIEPAFARMRDSLQLLRRSSQDDPRPALRPAAGTLDELEAAIEHELLPRLRQVGFDV